MGVRRVHSSRYPVSYGPTPLGRKKKNPDSGGAVHESQHFSYTHGAKVPIDFKVLSFSVFKNNLKNFYGSRVDLQCCVGFGQLKK